MKTFELIVEPGIGYCWTGYSGIFKTFLSTWREGADQVFDGLHSKPRHVGFNRASNNYSAATTIVLSAAVDHFPLSGNLDSLLLRWLLSPSAPVYFLLLLPPPFIDLPPRRLSPFLELTLRDFLVDWTGNYGGCVEYDTFLQDSVIRCIILSRETG